MSGDDLSGDILLDSVKYRVARREKGGLAYETQDQAVESGEGEWEIVIDDWSGGMGLQRLPSQQRYTKRFCFCRDLDATVPGILRPRGKNTAIATTNIIDALKSSFEHRIGSVDHIYLFGKENTAGGDEAVVVKCSLGATPAKLDEQLSGNSSDTPGQPARAYTDVATAGVKWHVPLDNSDRVWRLQTEAAGADTWTVYTTISGGARHFLAAGKRIARAHTNNLISFYAIGAANAFETDGNWGADTPAGITDYAITGLSALGRLVYAHKVEGLYGSSESGEILEMLPDVDLEQYSLIKAGFAPVVWHSKIRHPAGRQGLWGHDGFEYHDIGPDSYPENADNVSNITTEVAHGFHAGLSRTPHWLYSAYFLDVDDFYILVGRERQADDEAPHDIIWFPWVKGILTGGAEDGQYAIPISKSGANPRIWYVKDTQTVEYINLSDTGGPYRVGSTKNTGTGFMYQAEYDLGSPGTPKYIREAEFVIETTSANASWSAYFGRDGGAAAIIGAARTTSGSAYVAVPGTSDTFKRGRPEIRCTTNASISTSEVGLKKLILRGGYLPQKSDIYSYILDVGRDVMDSEGVFQDDPVFAKVAVLKADRTAGVLALKNHRDQDKKVIVLNVEEVTPQLHGLKADRAYVRVIMREVPYA